jgi:hypothetical protein
MTTKKVEKAEKTTRKQPKGVREVHLTMFQGPKKSKDK